MALILNNRYPGRANAPSAAYPQGSFKNRTAPGVFDGTYFEQDWANDWLAFFSSLIDAAGLTPNGLVDEVGASQYFDALQSISQAYQTYGLGIAVMPNIGNMDAGDKLSGFYRYQNGSSSGTTPTGLPGDFLVHVLKHNSLTRQTAYEVLTGAGQTSARAWTRQINGATVGAWSQILSPDTTPFPPSHISGLTLANDGGAPNTTISVGAGAARDSLDAVNIRITSALRGILQAAGSWAAGDNQNKLDAGARANSTTYHVFLIRKVSDGSGDILFSLSATSPTMPGGYSGFRRIGRIATDGSGNIRAFKDRGNGHFDWVTPIIEVTATGVANGTSLLTLTGLGGVGVRARINMLVSGDGVSMRATATDVTDASIGSTATTYIGGIIGETSAGSDSGAGEVEVFTDTSGQIRIRFLTSSGNVSYRVLTMGWEEVR